MAQHVIIELLTAVDLIQLAHYTELCHAGEGPGADEADSATGIRDAENEMRCRTVAAMLFAVHAVLAANNAHMVRSISASTMASESLRVRCEQLVL